MCKYPAPECKPIEEENQPVENETAEEDNEDEDEDYESSDSNSYYTESSIDIRSDSESDGESASGHRVTREMVLLLMLKEHGSISEEKYAEKAEICENNFRFLIPKLPRSSSVGSFDYTKDLSDLEDSDNENNDNKDDITDEVLELNDNNCIAEATVECNTDVSKDMKDIKFIDKVNVDNEDACDFLSDMVIGVSEKQCSEENTLQEQHGKLCSQSETKEVEEKMLDQMFEDYRKNYQEEQQKGTSFENFELSPAQGTNKSFVTEYNTESMKDEDQKQAEGKNREKHKNDLQDNHLGAIADKKIGININATKNEFKQDIDLMNSEEESKSVNQNSGNGNEVTFNGLFQESNSEQVEGKGIETNNDATKDTIKQDTVLIKPEEESMNETPNPNNENGMFRNLLQRNNLDDKGINTNSSTEDPTYETVVSTTPEVESKIKDQKSGNEVDPATGKITKSFKYIIKKLIREKRIPREDEDDRISDEYGEDYGRHLLSFADGLDRDYQNNTLTKLPNDDESDYDDTNLREFAFFLNFYSPSSYKYILETYNTPLPELKVLYSWYLKHDYSPGLSEKAFKILKEKSSVKRQTCTLMLIDIFLKNDGRYCDQVDYGQGEYYHFDDRAVLAYVFVLVSLDEEWKMPIGYILARNIPAETQAEYIRICLTHCFEAGIDVVAVTLENPTPAEFLGCCFENLKILKTTFKHPSCDREVAIWIDPCLALKSARQTLKIKGILKDDKGNKIRWNLIRKLRRLLTDDSIDLENPKFFELRNHLAKIGLTSETFSKSLILALELGEKLLPDEFTDIEPTTRYIAYINMLYSILNSRMTSRIRRLALELHEAKKYLLRLFSNEENNLSRLDRENLAWKRMHGYRFFLKGEPACGFIGFLICIESLKHLYTTLVTNEKCITFLNPQRLCKVHAEDLVTDLRAYDYLDPDTFSSERFQWFYKRLFEDLVKNPQFSDKNVSLQHWPLQNRYPPLVTIKLTSGKRSYDDVYSSQYKLKKMKVSDEEEVATNLVREYSKAMDIETDVSIKKNMVGFLAGWIAVKFAKCLKCEICIDALCTNNKLWFHEFIFLKQIYALCLPSEEIFRICWECERGLRLKGSVARLRAWVLRRLAPKFRWPSKRKHHPIHDVHLARAVIAKYIALRRPTPFSDKDRNKIVEMFKRFTTKDPDDTCDEYRIQELNEWLDGNTVDSDI